jgi:hypothetical protein
MPTDVFTFGPSTQSLEDGTEPPSGFRPFMRFS